MTKKQKAIIIGSILGDGFLQKTGAKNARLRLEHSLLQKEYLLWKCQILGNYFQSKPQILERKNPVFDKTYQYIRAQSYSGSELGIFFHLFYKNGKKIIPEKISDLLKDPLMLAVWFMDDGYYYPRDRIAYLYLPKLDQASIDNLLNALKVNFNLSPILKIKKRGEYVLNFSVVETKKLVQLIKLFVISSMSYKIPSESCDNSLKIPSESCNLEVS
ncbi:MAG: LAGLIDADG homing endonuclease [Candidatus Daviesbacteria bacterium GW2011_GWA1_41_61]|nr:MAG: LAGLIDADG homing endonuclease [Candidatus Daviesbacteria bacterium GW2011_GWB1_41_15]KKS14562.1 MAG: LAGLIDADG homing endonuclease [Candidatus Daviesbacteria bacterium GW2011_GWA1_41_61]